MGGGHVSMSQSLRGDQVFLGKYNGCCIAMYSGGLNPSVVIRSFWGGEHHLGDCRVDN